MNTKTLVWVNAITLIIMLLANAASSTGFLGNATVADVSHKYDTLFAPAGYAFAIWSVIFLFLVAFVIHQRTLLKTNHRAIKATGGWFAVSNLANAAWLYLWVNEKLLLSVIVIIFLLVCLCVLMVKLRLEVDDEPVRNIFFVWWPIAIYLGWIMVATIACIAAWLISIQWLGGPLSESAWTVIMIWVAVVLYTLLVVKRNLRETAGVGIWAFVAIAVRHWTDNSEIKLAALLAAAVLAAIITLHAYKNRAFNIGVKLKKGEWK